MTNYRLSPIGYLKSPFKEKFGLPRQAGLIQSEDAWIEFVSPFDTKDAFEGLEAFSHIWIHFLFHQNDFDTWRPKVRPPRLGGNQKIGVFATRSSFHPNGLGTSVVELKEVRIEKGKATLRVSCPDILDGTPIIDIKPYIAYSDAIPDAQSSYAADKPTAKLSVSFSEAANTFIQQKSKSHPNLRALIEEVLSLDPRPAYKPADDQKEYGMRLYDLNIKWMVSAQSALVTSIA